MSTVSTEMHSYALDRLAPSTQVEIHRAKQVAAGMKADEVFPEHLFLGALAQADTEVEKILDSLGLDLWAIRAQAAETFGIFDNVSQRPEESDLPLSNESMICFEWAIAFAARMDSTLLFPRHLVLGVLRHPRIQSLLALLVSTEEALPAPLLEKVSSAYKSFIDQLIHSRVREQSIINFSKSAPRRILRRFERPTVTFSDIRGSDIAKLELRAVAEFLRKPRNFQYSKSSYLYGVLLIGHPCTDRTLLVQATAGEAVVPLVSLSISTLVEMLAGIDSGSMFIEDHDLLADEYSVLKNSEATQRSRNILRHVFEQARKASPCILLIDNLDAIERLTSDQERERYWKQLVVEMDGLDYHPPMAVIATTMRTDCLGPELLRPGRFERQVVMSSGFMVQPAAQTKLCLSCKYENLSNWKFCVHCGASLAQVCPNCGALTLHIEGARFCFECGNPLSGIK